MGDETTGGSAATLFDVVVVGTGPAGIAAASALLSLDFRVATVERGDAGGMLADLFRQFPDDACGFCRLAPDVVEGCLRAAPALREAVAFRGEPLALEGDAPDLKLLLSGGRVLRTRAVLLATGGAEYRPPPGNPFLYGACDRVLTTLEFEKRLYSGLPIPGRLAFVLCVGSRDSEWPLCSAACCGYAFKAARLALARRPDARVSLFAMDLRAWRPQWWRYFDEAKSRGLEVVRCRVGRVESDAQALALAWESDAGEVVRREFDMVVLAVGQRPETSAAAAVGAETDEFGFVRADERGRTGRSGVWAAGYAVTPTDVAGAVSSGLAAACDVARTLGPRSAAEGGVAFVGAASAAEVLRRELRGLSTTLSVVRPTELRGAARRSGGWRLETDRGEVRARCVVLHERRRRLRRRGTPAPLPLESLDPDATDAESVVFLLCRTAFTKKRPYCMRTCCREALDAAARLMENSPGRRVYLLTREVMTPGHEELLHRRARAAGVLVLRYPHDSTPTLESVGDRVRVRYFDSTLGCERAIEADLVVEAAGRVVASGAAAPAEAFGLETDFRGAVARANPKYGAYETTRPTVLVMGDGDAPQVAILAAGRVRRRARRSPEVVTRRCNACGACVEVCPADCRRLENGRLMIDPVDCTGCGMCAAVCPSGAAVVVEAHEEVTV